ncbi:NAD(P)-dependent alcohol dehydrogenase [Candidatus Bathyarchaeota archaeon]|nr:NAD(P)-dependent alcohol dehydrogenase [Candidatus Bathyarchaeota archaeon]
MKAMVCTSLGKPLELQDLPLPKPSNDGVVLRVEVCGVCHSDLFHARGHIKGTNTPFIPGHEIVGTIYEMGPDVQGFSVGERVIVYPVFTCGICKECVSGLEHLCDKWYPIGWKIEGRGIDGGFAEYVHVPNFRNILKVEGLNPEEVAPLACAGLTALHALYEAQVHPDDLLVLIGVGGLGHMALQLAKNLMNVTVVAVDIDEKKLSLASKLGADYVINSLKEDPVAFVRKVSGRGADAVIDFVNNSETSKIAFQMLGRGGRHVFVGVYGGVLSIPTAFMVGGSFRLIGSFMGTRRHLMELISLYKRGIVKPMVSSKFKLEEANEAFNKLERGEIEGRSILKP